MLPLMLNLFLENTFGEIWRNSGWLPKILSSKKFEHLKLFCPSKYKKRIPLDFRWTKPPKYLAAAENFSDEKLSQPKILSDEKLSQAKILSAENLYVR